MATVNSLQMTKVLTKPQGPRLEPYEERARRRIAAFDFTVGAVAQPINDVIQLTQLPKGARIVASRICFTAGGAGAQLDIGTAASTAKYAAALDVSAAGTTTFADTIARNHLDLMTLEGTTIIQATVKGAVLAIGMRLYGEVDWILD